MNLFTNYKKEVLTRLEKLKTERTFFSIGNFFKATLIYTTDSTCIHTVFDYSEMNVYKCRECKGMIFLNQLNKK